MTARHYTNCQNSIISIFVTPNLKTRQPVLPYYKLSNLFRQSAKDSTEIRSINDFFQVFKITNDAIAPLERDFLLKLGCVENLAVSKLTMQSLSHLLTQISNIGG